MNLILCLLPVTLFLVFLYLLDSFNLVRVRSLIICLAWGAVCAGFSYMLNTLFAKWLTADFGFMSLYIAPLVEEIMKALVIIYFISRKDIGFLIDAAIYGFAAGAGFSLVENVTLILTSPEEYKFLIFLVRGFGTGLMHGGCTAFFSILLIGGVNRSRNIFISALVALLLASIIHSAFNHFLFSPVLQTLLVLVILPLIFVTAFRLSISRLQKWLEIEFSSEVEMLQMIRKGEFGASNMGSYLKSLRNQFSPETIVDMYCYIGLYIELSIKAKRNLMLVESGFDIIIENDIQSKLDELMHLRKRIGRVGELALAPLIRMNYRNLWKLNQLVANNP
jgi:protease PrsW